MKFTHLHEAAAFAYRAAKDAPFVNTGQTVPVLVLLEETLGTLHESVMRLGAAYGNAMSNKGTLNEKQFPQRLERARKSPDALRAVKREQAAARCRYESGRIVIHPTRWHVRAAIDAVEGAIKEVLAFAETLSNSDADGLLRDVCQNNCLKARQLIASAKEVWEKASSEICHRDSDVTQGRSREAVVAAFDELTKSESDRLLLLWNDDMLFAENLDISTDDAELAQLMRDFQARFADAWEKLHEAKFESAHLQQNRGTLNEEQYAAKIEKASEEEFDRLYKAQRLLRQAHYACMVSLRWKVQAALDAVDALEPFYQRVLDILVNDEKYPVNQLSKRVMNSRGGELIVYALMNNCIAAEALIRDTRGRKAKQFAEELARDVTDGQAKAASDELVQEMRASVRR